MKEPGGFRRNFLSARAQERGEEEPPMIRNVVDFLFLYGHFAGEDLDEDEDVDDDDEQADAEEGRGPSSSRAGPATERTPLLQRSMSKTRKRSKSVHNQGTASLTQAVLMLLKGFVGTGVLFMGKAFFNGGILFSTVVLLAIAAISLWSFLLLVETWMKVPGSFGDIGGQLYGNWLRITILFSITVSQIGFVAAYTIFIAENLRAFILAVTDCKTDISTATLIFAQLLLFLPLAMIRNLAKLSGTALVADAFILVGLVYIASCEVGTIVQKGVAPDVVMFNHDNFPLLIGTAVFAFEGIGLYVFREKAADRSVIPITETMKEPHKFPRALSGVMLFVAILFSAFGVLGYAAYGSEVQTVVLVNLPQDEKFVQGSQFLYSIAILLSIPLQLFPAVRIMETGLFSRSGKHNRRVKWQKNVFRAGTVLFCSLLSWAGSSELDKFVSLVGAFACLPLCFIYPPMLHLRGCARTRTAKALDYLLLAFGIVVGVYSTVQTLRSLFAPNSGDSPTFGKC
jgi:proton-coupled amino acid transporter